MSFRIARDDKKMVRGGATPPVKMTKSKNDYANNYFLYSLFETSQSLFWASFGLVDLMAFELQGIKSFTRFWAMLMFGSYSVINIIVLLNMLIAMMSNSYQIISVFMIRNQKKIIIRRFIFVLSFQER